MESSFRAKLRKHIRSIGRIESYPVESHSASPGMPDVHYICMDSGKTGWIELKEVESFTPRCVSWRQGQVPWLLSYAKNRGRCWVGIYVRSSNEFLLFHGRFARENPEWGAFPMARFHMDSPTVWTAISRVLRLDEVPKEANL